VVLAEVAARLPALDAPPTVPFFRNNDEDAMIWRLGQSGDRAATALPIRPQSG